MRLLVCLCVGLLVLIAALQWRILQRLDAAPGTSVSTSATSLVTEFRRQMLKEAPPAFSFEFQNSSSISKFQGVTQVGFRMIRREGLAGNVSIKVLPGISVRLSQEHAATAFDDPDYYSLAFERTDAALPAAWTFSVAYTDQIGARAERVFEVCYNPKSPTYFQVAECLNRQPDTAVETTVAMP